MRRVVLFVLGMAIFGCRNDPIVIYRDVIVNDDATVRDDLNVGDDVNVGGTITVDHINADSATIGGVEIGNGNVSTPGDIKGDTVIGNDVVDLPDEPDEDNGNDNDDDDGEPTPLPLMSSLRSVSGDDHFDVGEDVKMVFAFSGGTPPYDSRCQIPDGTFAIEDDSPDNSFTFKKVMSVKDWTSFKIINSPGSGVITCRVTSADGQQVSSSFTIYVGPQ